MLGCEPNVEERVEASPELEEFTLRDDVPELRALINELRSRITELESEITELKNSKYTDNKISDMLETFNERISESCQCYCHASGRFGVRTGMVLLIQYKVESHHQLKHQPKHIQLHQKRCTPDSTSVPFPTPSDQHKHHQAQ